MNADLRKTIKRITASILIILMSVALFSPAVYGVVTKQKVKVGCFPLNGFYDFDEKGNVSGYGVAYTDEVSEHTGWEIEYVKYSSWVEAIEALSENKIDILAPAQHNKQRDAMYAFDTFPIGTEYGSMLTLSTNDKLTYEDYTSFNGLKVGCVGTLAFLDSFKEYEKNNGFNVKLSYYKDTPALVAALNAGEVDAIVANLMVKNDSMKILSKFGASPYYYMLSSRANNLIEDLNKTVDKISTQHPEFQGQLMENYYPELNSIPFSKKELDYIKNVEKLVIGCSDDFAPFSYVDEKTGKTTGVYVAIFQRISKITGLKFDYCPIDSKDDTDKVIKDKNISIIAGVENDGNLVNLHGGQFTDAYLNVSKNFVGSLNTAFDRDKKMKVAIVTAENSQLNSWKKLYPNFKFTTYSSVDDCVNAVKSGKEDLLLNDRYLSERILSSPRNTELHIMPTESLEGSICAKITTSKNPEDMELLVSILNKAISRIANSDKENYISEYVQATAYKYTLGDFIYQYRYVIILILMFVVMAVLGLVSILKERRIAQKAIAENELKLRHITNNINGGVIVLKANEGLEITFANDGFLDLIGCSRQALELGSYLTYVYPDDMDKVHDAINSEDKEISLELRITKSDGTYLPAMFNGTVGLKSNGEKELYCVIIDMTENNKLLEQLKIENKRTELILDRVEEIFYEVNLREHTITCSSSFAETLGWSLPHVLESTESKYFDSLWRIFGDDLPVLKNATKKLLGSKENVSSMIRIECKPEKRYIWSEILQYPIVGEDGMVASVIGLIRNVDEQVKERERLVEQARRDSLTGLYNKEAFGQLVKASLDTLPGQNHSLIFIDLDHFKNLNDTLGHMTGDVAICEAADKLKVIFSSYDILSRFGGDEFCILVKNIPIETLRDKMQWLVEKLHHTYHGEAGDVAITCSCGIACTEKTGFDYKELMSDADKALYYSKENGRDRFTFSFEMEEKSE